MQMASAVGIPSKTSWSTTALRRSAGGVIYVAAGFSGDEQTPGQGREFVHWLEDRNFESPAQLYQLVRNYWQEVSGSTAASIALVFQQDTHITVMSFGFAMIGLLRGEESRWLIDGQGEEQVLEGSLQSGDRLLLATARARDVSPSLEIWQNATADDIASDLFGRISSHPNSGELAYNVLEWRDQSPVHSANVEEDAGDYSDLDQNSPTDEVQFEINQGQAGNEKYLDDQSGVSGQDLEEKGQTAPGASHTFTADSRPSVPKSPVGSSHLIAPEKIAAGIVATQQEQVQKVEKQRLSDRWVGIIARLQSLSWLRLVAAIVLIGGVVGGVMIWRELNIRQENRDVIVPLEQEVEALQTIPEEQRLEQRDSAKSLLERLQATRVNSRSNRTRLIELTTQVEQIYQTVSGERDVVNLPIFYDFRLVVANFLATKADRFEDQAVFLDANEKKLINLNLQSKNNRTVSQEALADSRDIVADALRAVVLKQETVEEMPYSGDAPSIISNLSDMTEPALLDEFGTNLYVLDKGKQQLWRINQENESASPSAWIRSAPGVDFASTTSLTIDGDIWLGTNQGNIYRLRRGERLEFLVEGLLEPFTSTLLLATTEDGNKLAVVEPAQNRLVVLSKDGVYQLQMKSEQIGGVTDIFLSQDERYAYLVAGSVVYQVEI